jgi:hypothetical protein
MTNGLEQHRIAQQIPVVEQVTLLRFVFSAEKVDGPAGTQWFVHLDSPLSPVAARRVTLAFDAAGFDAFRDGLAAAGAGVEIARPGML